MVSALHSPSLGNKGDLLGDNAQNVYFQGLGWSQEQMQRPQSWGKKTGAGSCEETLHTHEAGFTTCALDCCLWAQERKGGDIRAQGDTHVPWERAVTSK